MKNYEAACLKLQEYSKQHKIYRSEEREFVLSSINNIDSHFSIASLLEFCQKTQHISRATVYNNVNLFLKVGVVIRHPFDNNPNEEYEAVWRSSSHHHRVCLECGAVKEFTEKKIQTPIKNKHFTAFEKSYSSLYIYGICKKCQKKYNVKRS